MKPIKTNKKQENKLYKFDATFKCHGYGIVEAKSLKQAKKKVEKMDYFELIDTELISVISCDEISEYDE